MSNIRFSSFSLALLALAGTGCGTFAFGSAPTPVFSASSSSARGAGAQAEIQQIETRLRIHASHVCDVVRKEERTAGAQAEIFHPLEQLNAARNQQEQEAAHLGPITEGIFRGSDDAEMQKRSMSNELQRGATPWMIGAAAVGLLETVLKATARVHGKVTGEHHEGGGSQHSVPCLQDDPYVGADVALMFRGESVRLGCTDARGDLTVDLAEALASRADGTSGGAEGEVLVDGCSSGRVRLDGVMRALEAHRSSGLARSKP